ncbi:MAG: PIN domain-containing protein [Coriobacteriia bacterium]|nr:PIN domain-containing protein [Coriobacteriia bacterium]
MSYFLDTNACIYLLKGEYPLLQKRLLEQRPSSIKIPAMVLAELYAGANESSELARTKSAIESFVAAFEVVNFDQNASRVFGELRAHMSRAALKIGAYDLIIAATVISREGVLVTHNTKEFNRIADLSVEDWTQELLAL